MYKYISLIVSVFCSGLSAQSQTVSFLHSIPLGLLLGFLICPLFPLNSPGYFPKNTSAPFVVFLFFSPQAWAHFLLWTHVENTRLSTQCVHFPNDIVLRRAHTCGVIADECEMTIRTRRQRKPSCDCCLNLSRVQSGDVEATHHSRN